MRSEAAARRAELTESCFNAVSAVERLLNQLGEKPNRIVRPGGGGLAFVFLGASRYGMPKIDDDGVTVARLGDRANDSKAETWVVEAGGLTNAVRTIRAFLGAPHGKNR